MTDFLKIGFIGLGAMGMPMAACVQKAGFQVLAAKEQDDGIPASRLASLGVKIVESFQDVMSEAELLITMLPGDKEILEVYLGVDGIICHAAKNCVCLDLTSAKGQTIIKMAEEFKKKRPDIHILDGAVSGGTDGAKNGALTIMTAGDQALLERFASVLESMGKSIFFCGELGSAKNIKIINQLLNAGNTCVMAEAMFLAEQWGLDIDFLIAVVEKSSGNSWVMQNNYPKFMRKGFYDGGFRLSLMLKDVMLAAGSGLDLPVSDAVIKRLDNCCDSQTAAKNYNIVYESVKRKNQKREDATDINR